MSNNQGIKEAEAEADMMLRGQVRLWRYLKGEMDAVAVRGAIQLRIADIINNHGGPMSISQIAHAIGSPTLNVDGLSRLMRFLAHRNVFDSSSQQGEEPTVLYSLNHCSKWLVHDAQLTMAPVAIFFTDPFSISAYYDLSRSIQQGVSTFKTTYGEEVWEVASHDQSFNRVFNEGMACYARIISGAVISNYGSGFQEMSGTLVDVGGGTGLAISEIVKAYPHLKGINFDLPHVIATTPTYDKVTHVGGDMFKAIPPADSILIQLVLHNWNDDDCVKILKNCRKVIPEKTGRVIIVDIVMNPGGDRLFDEIGVVFDVLMLACFSGGKERTESGWKKILEEGGFPRHNIIKIPAIPSIIVAYPQ